MKEEEKGISLGREISLIEEESLNLVDAVFDEFDSRVGEDGIETHDRVTAHVEVAMEQVLNHCVHQVLQDRLYVDFRDQTQSSPSDELVRG
jgi:hypothetical protein